ncbi:SDR family oxidoreductase [Streptomyces sp. M19]
MVGRSILREPTELRLVAATHSASVPDFTGPTVSCDLTAERFGLDEESYAALADEVDVVIHSGGLTEWGCPPSGTSRSTSRAPGGWPSSRAAPGHRCTS